MKTEPCGKGRGFLFENNVCKGKKLRKQKEENYPFEGRYKGLVIGWYKYAEGVCCYGNKGKYDTAVF